MSRGIQVVDGVHIRAGRFGLENLDGSETYAIQADINKD